MVLKNSGERAVMISGKYNPLSGASPFVTAF
jgi:hypothetical protein